MTPMIGEGTYAKCYLLDGGIVKKIYKNRIPSNQKGTIGVENDTYVFAHFMDEKNKYTLLKYVEGIPFLKVVDGEYIPFADPYLVDFEASLKKLYKEIKSDMVEKDVFLDKFETDGFSLNFENSDIREDLYYVMLEHNVKMPMQYSDTVIEKVYTEGIVAEDKLQIEYILLSIVAIRDIINGNFKDAYIAEFACSLFKKKQKLESILSLISNQALQEKISLNITYSDYIKNQKGVLEYTKKGYDFVITLDDSIKSVEDV